MGFGGGARANLGYIYSWTGKVSSSYGTAGNWYNNNAGATATSVPGTSDEALVVASGAINGPGAAFELGLTGTATGLTAGGSLFGSYVYVGGNHQPRQRWCDRLEQPDRYRR